uniref:Putative secreted protein n=1 Tax=Ixodes ricinus TaxID=34613 RepID=A0A6B0UAV3_IXORI
MHVQWAGIRGRWSVLFTAPLVVAAYREPRLQSRGSCVPACCVIPDDIVDRVNSLVPRYQSLERPRTVSHLARALTLGGWLSTFIGVLLSFSANMFTAFCPSIS